MFVGGPVISEKGRDMNEATRDSTVGPGSEPWRQFMTQEEADALAYYNDVTIAEYVRDRPTLFGPATEATRPTPQERTEAIRSIMLVAELSEEMAEAVLSDLIFLGWTVSDA